MPSVSRRSTPRLPYVGTAAPIAPSSVTRAACSRWAPADPTSRREPRTTESYSIEQMSANALDLIEAYIRTDGARRPGRDRQVATRVHLAEARGGYLAAVRCSPTPPTAMPCSTSQFSSSRAPVTCSSGPYPALLQRTVPPLQSHRTMPATSSGLRARTFDGCRGRGFVGQSHRRRQAHRERRASSPTDTERPATTWPRKSVSTQPLRGRGTKTKPRGRWTAAFLGPRTNRDTASGGSSGSSR